MNPVSPYGCSKVFGYNIVRNYRNAYKLHACNGILFNHESPRRGSNFVTNKVVKTAVEIKLGLTNKLVLGNMDSYRDWGHSKDYVRAMHAIINNESPDDFVVSTMKTHSVREMVEYVFGKLELDYNQYVSQNLKFLRPEELKYLKGDSTKIRTKLGWNPEYTFETMLDEMIEYWVMYYTNNK
jgi:GDPmannose 4,6-dehydratase